MAITYNNLYLDIRQSLIEEEIPGAALEAREILCYAAGKTRDEFFRDLPLYAPDDVQEEARDMLRRRLAGEPIAYLIGEWEFYSIPLNLDRNVLIPRIDTELLARAAIECAAEFDEPVRLMDLCTGSGCVGIAFAANVTDARAVLADISPDALSIARQNVRRNELAARVSCVAADALKEPNASNGEFDIITCNPPYITEAEMEALDLSVRGHEPELALYGGVDGMDFFRAVSVKWKSALKNGGRLLFECGVNQIEHVHEIMAGAGFVRIKKFNDTQGIGRVVMGTLYK